MRRRRNKHSGRTAAGAAHPSPTGGNELREDGARELREDGSIELRE
jgi:hypothetical protein